MNITVIGASGRTGREVVHHAVDAGHRVTAIARRLEKIEDLASDMVTIACGDVLADDALPIPVDTDAVISALGPDDGRKPTTIYSDGTATVLGSMRARDIRRLVVISAAPVAAPADRSLFERVIVHPILWKVFGESYRDLRRMEEMLRTSTDIDWTVVRPPRLTDAIPTGEYRIGAGHLRGAREISRGDLAHALVDLATDQQWVRSAVTVTK